jgi:translation initiation factor 2D
MDEQFKEALLNALKLAVDDNELPIDSGMFYTEYILPARREGVTLDIKQSSFKKMNKFYESMDRLGLIEFKQGKQKNGAVGSMITKVHRDNETLSEHIPTIKKLAVKG